MDLRQAKPPARRSQQLWGLDWTRHTPWNLDGQCTVAVVPFDEAWPFIRDNYATIFETDQQRKRFFEEPFGGAKKRFYRESDVFLFRDEALDIGVLIFHPTDWSTYYLRTGGMRPEYQKRGLVGECMRRMCQPLKEAGVNRFESECAPSGFASVRLLTGLGFNVTGTTNTDRWGNMLRFTKFLHEDAEEAFLEQYCSGVVYQRRGHNPK